MKDNSNSFDVVRFLKSCASHKNLSKGSDIHAYIQEHALLEQNPYVVCTLVNMYVKCGALDKAKQAIEGLPVRDSVTWNALIAGYAQQGQGRKVLKCFDSMQREGHTPDAITFNCALKACGSIGAVARGEQIHNKIVSLGLLETNAVLGNSLVDMYARCAAFSKAQEVLEGLPVRDVVTWNTLITGYTQQGQGEEALKCFDSMQREGHSPNAITFNCILKACGCIGALTKGEEIHDKIVSLGMLKKNVILGNTLVDMYARCGVLERAQRVLEGLLVRDVITWNALIAGYAQHGKGEEALKCFDSMQQDGHTPDVITFNSALKACGFIGAAAKGEQIHDQIVSLGMLEKNSMLGATLVDMYAKCAALEKAQQVLEGLPVRNAVVWNALIGGYAQRGQGEEALKCFDNMQREGHCPNVVTFISALKACGIIGAAAKVEEIHAKILSLGMLDKNIELGNTLVDMYAKCYALTKALEVHKELPIQNVVTWNALIGGYAQQGYSFEALNCFERMQSKGTKPNVITLVCVLSACSHSGLLDQAEMLFLRMNATYDITPNVEHYSCMVDIFSRAGKFNKALMVIEKMSSVEYCPLWAALLGACREWVEVKIAELAFNRVLHLDGSDLAVYICMSDTYRAAGMQEDADKIEAMRVAYINGKSLDADALM